jgi:tripartite-type tricarboxylate transporter receptor subunit TctC
VSVSLSQIHSGKVRPLATLGATRAKALADVPTLKELGYDTEYYVWVGIFAPKGTPEPAISYLRSVLNAAAHSDQFVRALSNVGLDLAYLDQPDFAVFWDKDAARIEDAVRLIGPAQN